MSVNRRAYCECCKVERCGNGTICGSCAAEMRAGEPTGFDFYLVLIGGLLVAGLISLAICFWSFN